MMALVAGVLFAVDLRRVEVVGVRLDVDEHRRRALVEDRVDARGERERRDEDLIARPDPEGRTIRCRPAVPELTATP